MVILVRFLNYLNWLLKLEVGVLSPAAWQRNLISGACTHNLIVSVTTIDEDRDIEHFVCKLSSCHRQPQTSTV